MNLSLLVQVYNGGNYWRECLDSVKANLDLFDAVYVSIGKSSKQEEDIALLQELKTDKLRWRAQDRDMSAVEHGKRFDQWVGSFQPRGHIFTLCHDDILLREGLLKLKELELTEHDAVFGSFRFFSDDGSSREMTVREFYRKDGPFCKNEFFYLQDQQHFTYNISGTVLPAKLYTAAKPLTWHLLSYGCRSELCHFCSPQIKKIHQIYEPTVKIRRHAGSEGSRMPEAALQYDTLVYLLLAFSASHSDKSLCLHLSRSLGYTVLKSPFRGIWYFLLLQFRLMKVDFYYPHILKIYGYILSIIFQKLKNRLKRRG